MEIEKKYKIAQMPENLEQYKKKVIRQGYLCTGPVVRIRQSNDNYILTYKNRKGKSQKEALTCQEIEMELTREAFLHLSKKTDGNFIEKTRYLIPLEGKLTAELDIFEGKLLGLYFVEVEFENEKQAAEFIPPFWFGEEVTHDKRFRNSFLSTVSSVSEIMQ